MFSCMNMKLKNILLYSNRMISELRFQRQILMLLVKTALLCINEQAANLFIFDMQMA